MDTTSSPSDLMSPATAASDATGNGAATQRLLPEVSVDFAVVNDALQCRRHAEDSNDSSKSLRELLNKFPKTCDSGGSGGGYVCDDVDTQQALEDAKGGEKAPKPDDSKQGDRALCAFYWILFTSIGALIAFSIWISVQIGFKHAQMLATRGKYSARKC